MRCPGLTIQLLNYDYSQYVRKVLELVEIDPDKIEWGLYDEWTPYQSDNSHDKLQNSKKD